MVPSMTSDSILYTLAARIFDWMRAGERLRLTPEL